MAQRKKTKNNRQKTAAQKPALKAESGQPFRFRDFLKTLGPGLITGASDDDPSGIGTYSQAGAQLGYGIGWTMLLTFPLMAAIQEISARVGRVTGHGIAGNACRHYSASLLTVMVALLFIANTINIAADLGAMADATKLLIGGGTCRHRLRAGVRGDVGAGADFSRLLALRVGAEMADAQPVRLCRRAGVCACFVERGPDRHPGAAHQLERRLFHHHRRHPRHHDLALSVFLAGLAGGRGPARRRHQGAADRKALWRANRNSIGFAPTPSSAWRSRT